MTPSFKCDLEIFFSLKNVAELEEKFVDKNELCVSCFETP